MKQRRLVRAWTAAATLPLLAAATSASTGLAPSLLVPKARLIAFTAQHRQISPRSSSNNCRHRHRLLISRVSSIPASCPPRVDYSHESRSLFALFASSSDGDNDEAREEEDTSQSNDENNSMSIKVSEAQSSVDDVPTPPKFLAMGYNMAALTNILAGLILIWNLSTISSASISAASSAELFSTRYQPNLLATYTAGSLGHLLLSAGTCSVLSSSVNSNRLFTSDTYKRLTLGSFLFGLMGLFSLPGEAGCIMASSPSAATIGGMALVASQLAKFLTAFVSFVGWEYSAGGFGSSRQQRIKNIFGEVVKGFKNLWKTLPVTKERPATFYRTFFIFITLGNIVFNIPELVFNLKQGGVVGGLFSLPVSLTLSSIARLGLMSVVLNVLKDAAERKRLEGSTFIKLNMMVGLWALGGECFL